MHITVKFLPSVEVWNWILLSLLTSLKDVKLVSQTGFAVMSSTLPGPLALLFFPIGSCRSDPFLWLCFLGYANFLRASSKIRLWTCIPAVLYQATSRNRQIKKDEY